MSDLAIRVDRVCKRYEIGVAADRAANLQEAMFRAVTAPLRMLRGARNRGEAEILWALKDVSFELTRGEVLGVIGRNGAGKSTLLKVLSRITAPSTGEIELHGRLASLLEVGTGFHPELTGRENVYLNGAMLGMQRREIAQKFDAIVDFSGVERFLDTPVKRYSSGMYTRLAFAVAAHLDPEILVVDEVLAVGDVSFQKKCLGKMGEVAKAGRTVLFVSHQMNAVRRLCSKCLWMDNGQVRMLGPTAEVLGRYEAACNELSADDSVPNAGVGSAQFLSWELRGANDEDPNVLRTMGEIELVATLRVIKPIRHGHHGVALWNQDNQLMWGWAAEQVTLDPGIHELRYRLAYLPLRPGSYRWQFSLYEDQVLADNWYGIPDMIVATDPLAHQSDAWAGVLNIPIGFSIEERAISRTRAGSLEQVRT